MAMGKEKMYGLGLSRSKTAFERRSQQLKEWERSDTNKQPDYIASSRRTPRVKFGENIIFMAAVQSGDIEEVERLVSEDGADVNSVNEDGLTALHQCCIDDDFDMVQVLVRHGADVNVRDNEGWTPLHAATNCGYLDIVRYLLQCGANPVAINFDGDSPLKLVEDDDIRELIEEEIEKQNVDVDSAKNEEEERMLEDAHHMKNDPSITPLISKGGATPLHVAAAKGYVEVMKVLLSMKKTDVDATDDDGWTPLLGAVYWCNMEAAELLVTSGADLNRVTNSGDTIDDLCDPECTEDLDHLRKIDEEQSTRNRRYAMILTRGDSRTDHRPRPPLTHSNSRDDMKPSPVIRRRSSKERSLFPKMDMRQEREERENWSTDSSSSVEMNGAGKSADTCSLPVLDVDCKLPVRAVADSSEPEPPSGQAANNIKEAANSLHEAAPNHQAPPPSSTTVTPKYLATVDSSPDSSPNLQRKQDAAAAADKAKKKHGMSLNMRERMKLWEAQKSSSSAGPLTSTPVSSPQVTERKTEEAQPKVPEIRRFPFQSRTVTPDRPPSDVRARPASTSYRSDQRLSRDAALDKRVSVDEARLKNLLKPAEDSTPRSTSLPRGAKIDVTDHVPLTPEKDLQDVSVVSSEATPTPGSGTEDSSVHRTLSRAGSLDSVGSRSSLSEESNTKRKVRAKKTRETRKQTQPIPLDILEKITQHDASELEQCERGEGEGEEGTGKDKLLEPAAAAAAATEEGRRHDSLEVKPSDGKPDGLFRPTQSAYKPVSRPSPRFRSGSNPASTLAGMWASPERKKKVSQDELASQAPSSKVPSSPTIKVHSEEDIPAKDEEDGASMADDSSLLLMPSHSRTKSNARRRPRKERRSTGIGQCEVEEGQEVCAELSAFVVKKADSVSVVEASSSDSFPASTQSSPGQSEDIARLKALLAEEGAKCRRLKEQLAESEILQGKISSLTRRCEDVSRAYEQEKKEKELKEARIRELTEGSKSLQELRSENQRLKDENSALIRVIGKLSRAPVHT